MDVANVASSSAKHGGNTDGPLSAGAGPIRHGRIPKVVSKTFDPSTQACQHCRKRKRKCDRLTPACSNCAKAKIECIFDFRVTDKTHPGYVERLIRHGDELEERVKWLEDIVASLEPGLDIRSVTTNSTLPLTSAGSPASTRQSESQSPPSATFDADAATNFNLRAMAKQMLHLELNDPDPTFLVDATPLGRYGASSVSSNYGSPGSDDQSAVSLPSYDDACVLMEAYFNNNGVAYPFLEKNQFKADMDELFRDPNIEHPNRSHRVIIFRVFLVLAIGATNIQQIEDGAAWSTSTTFYHRALQELDTVLEREDIECVQNLLLLSIFTTFNVEGPSIWATLGFAIRLAVGLGLHRRVGPEKGSPAELERRRRTWWSLYNFDRVVAFTLGRPLSIADEDIDIELPSMDADYDTGNPAFMYYTLHLIRQRRLFGIIMRDVYCVSPNPATDEQRQGILQNIHNQVDHWYRSTPVPLPNTEPPPGRGFANTLYFSMAYNLTICALYRPSPLIPTPTRPQLDTLFRASTRCLDAFWDLQRKKRIAVNHINILQMFTSAISLLYCLCEYGAEERNISDIGWRNNTLGYVKSCRELLAEITQGWSATEKYREIFETLVSILLERCQVRERPPIPPPLPPPPAPLTALSSAASSTTALNEVESVTDSASASAVSFDSYGSTSSDPGDIMQSMWLHDGGAPGPSWQDEADVEWDRVFNGGGVYGTLQNVPPPQSDAYSRVFSHNEMDMSGGGHASNGHSQPPGMAAWNGYI